MRFILVQNGFRTAHAFRMIERMFGPKPTFGTYSTTSVAQSAYHHYSDLLRDKKLYGSPARETRKTFMNVDVPSFK
jgi:hypothetical protein